MIRRYITITISLIMLFLVVTPTNALYEQSIQMTSGDVYSVEIETTPPRPDLPNGSEIKNNVYISSGMIETNLYVTNGPIHISLGSITGGITTNQGVSIEGIHAIQGPIYRQPVSFEPKSFDYSMVPESLPVRGDFSNHYDDVINSSGQYYNMNISKPLTIDTTNGDVVIITEYINIGSEILVTGNHRAVLIVRGGLNFNHNSMNSTKHPDFSLVVQSLGLHLQNEMNIYGNLYFEGYSLNFSNRIQFHGEIYAPLAKVELNASNLYGTIHCDSLGLHQNANILESERK